MPAVPRPKAVKDLLEGMLEREIELKPANPPRAGDLSRTAIAIYVDPNFNLAAVAGAELPLAATVGAAMGAVPPGAVQACVAERALSPKIAEKFEDVCESLTALLNKEGQPRIRLYQVFLPGKAAPGDASSRLLALGSRLDLDVTVPGYPAGKLSLSL
jgi:hypothetical protein